MSDRTKAWTSWGVIAGRALLVSAASAAVWFGAPTVVTTVASLLAMAVVAERLARTRGRSRIDAVLVAVGGLLVTLILLGLLLGVSGIGLGPRSWALALAAVALAALTVAEYVSIAGIFNLTDADRATAVVVDAPTLWARLRPVPWVLASTAVVVGALILSVRATDRADVAPLQMAFGTVQGANAQVVVSSQRASGPLELRTQAPDGTTLSYPLFSLEPGRPMSASVQLPMSGRFVVTLNNPDQSEPLRSLILDR